MSRRLDAATLRKMAAALDPEDRDEMAIPSYLHRNPALRWMAWRRVVVVAELLREQCPKGGTVLDYGCGTGVLFEDALHRADRVIGVDLVLAAARMLTKQRGLDRVELLEPDAARLEIAENTADVIVAAEVLEHIDDLPEVSDFFARTLKPMGQLLVSLPTENRAYRLGRRLAGFTGDYHEHDAASIDRLLKGRGWRPVERRHIPLPGPACIYLVASYRPPLG
jgi:ubiquinone/menaquinone biosynthesis C-methylase UbiE